MGDRKRVVVAVHPEGRRFGVHAHRLEAAGLQVDFNPHPRSYTETELCRALDGTFAVIAGDEPYTEPVFEAAKDLKLVARWGVGYDRVDVAAATRHGVAIAMAFGGNHESVADCTLVLMGALAEKLILHHDRVKRGGWGYEEHRGLWRATVGIIGLGRIGKAVARRCRGFEMRVLAYDVQPDVAFARDSGVVFVPLETLLAEADFVTLHAPQNAGSTDLINAKRLALMKRTAILINTARGGLVDEVALLEALTTGRIGGAGLDVFKHEPPLGSPLLALPNVVATPHIAGNDVTAQEATAERCLQSVLAVADGRSPAPECLLNPEALDRRCLDSGSRG
jgi:phosphoglycerate dehydrogenase-like enzyme